MKLKTYHCLFAYEVGGRIEVKAKDEKQARQIAHDKLNDNGEKEFLKICHRSILHIDTIKVKP